LINVKALILLLFGEFTQQDSKVCYDVLKPSSNLQEKRIPMNVFILCSGRTASTALSAACQHITNFTSAHESRVNILSKIKLDYPDQHIEIDNRLIWFSELLDEKFGKSAKYIHLTRDKHKVAASYAERWQLTESIVKAYGHGILMKPKIAKSDRLQVCLDYVEFVEKKIELFLKDKPESPKISVENLSDDFVKLWGFVGAQGNLEFALSEFDKRHNTNKLSFLGKIRNALPI
jgi:phosphopantetheinyl transferase (holo-ACP synthase)